MASINTGMQRATELTVIKLSGDKIVTGYPRIYRLTDAFGSYIAVPDSDLAMITINDYKERLSAFKKYVESVEIGITVNTSDAYVENIISCPIN